MTLRRVITAIDMSYDGGVVHVPARLLVDIPPGSATETAYGTASNLEDLSGNAAAAAAAAERAGASN